MTFPGREIMKDGAEAAKAKVAALSDQELAGLLKSSVQIVENDRRENQLCYYQPVSAKVVRYHAAAERTVAMFGGNGSSKTDGQLVEICIRMTGIVPDSLEGIYPREKIKHGKYRLTVTSKSTAMDQFILPKLQWWMWDGIDEPGGRRGHWGWIPRRMLIGGDWNKSWDTRSSVLTLQNNCTLQIMSSDQVVKNFQGDRLRFAGHDELPPWPIWRENVWRVAGLKGTMSLAMTPPDEAGIDVGWVYDQIYMRGLEGSPSKDPQVLALQLSALDNPHLDRDEVERRAQDLTWEQQQVRLYGDFLHLSNRIHPFFTDQTMWWCFDCGSRFATPAGNICPRCESRDITSYKHVEDFEYNTSWPVIFTIDPHPARPHMMQWAAVNPYDEILHVAEVQVQGEPDDVMREVRRVEDALGLHVVMRIMDPNMGRSPGQKGRGVTWQEDFAAVGLYCEMGDDNFEAGKSRINMALKPDRETRRPRMVWHSRCQKAAFQYQRYVMDPGKGYSTGEKNPRETPKNLNDDYPAQDRYLMNAEPSFRWLRGAGSAQRGYGQRRYASTGY